MSVPVPIAFVVYGVPMTKGSARAFVPKGWTRPIITSTNKGLKDWEHKIASAAQVHAGDSLLTCPVHVRLAFHLPRPKSLKKTIQLHAKRPDLDKLIRAATDALTKVLWNDDGQIVSIYATKHYTETMEETPRVEFTITPLAEDGPLVDEVRPGVFAEFQ